MSVTLVNAPLVELIAEIRWRSASEGGASVSELAPLGPVLIMDTGGLDEFYMHFGGRAFAMNFASSERLSPAGVPTFLHQPVYRFKKTTDGVVDCLYQVGPGIFSANAIPPYKSWEQFAPVIRAGLEALLASRPSSEVDEPIMAVSLRYIDLFGPALMGDQTPAAFIRDVLGLRLEIPPALSGLASSEAEVKPFLQLQIPMRDGMAMSFSVGEGGAAGRQGVIMDTSVATTVDVAPSVDAVMQAFNVAHEAIDASFRKLIAPLSKLLPAEKGE
ncbi:TIGR04255 family protein [Janthinobacterium sp. GW458P]|uniref:TIGR04255 family protein n=1 Tax=Janthinobacterium sp. GW458P TaxID=1981504 RepID=UPI000A327A96|nr:TIGR04255 family protein [Janthinobacterium sp. GW458P]MBE3025970.1 TIGR04255 family protein [Janthinobacterium sp. GW458P]